jgi:CRP-like cAMP-binding protein
MISTELIRRYPLFAGLDRKQLEALASFARELSVKAGEHIFKEKVELDKFYLVIQGEVAIYISVPDRNLEQKLVDQLYRRFAAQEVTVATVGPGEMFGWSALIPPNISTAGAKTKTDCLVIEFNYQDLEPLFEEDDRFAYLMTLKAAQTIRGRLQNMHIESLASLPA